MKKNLFCEDIDKERMCACLYEQIAESTGKTVPRSGQEGDE